MESLELYKIDDYIFMTCYVFDISPALAGNYICVSVEGFSLGSQSATVGKD